MPLIAKAHAMLEALGDKDAVARLKACGKSCREQISEVLQDEVSKAASLLIQAVRERRITADAVCKALSPELGSFLHLCYEIDRLTQFDSATRSRIDSRGEGDRLIGLLLDIIEQQDPDTRPMIILASSLWSNLKNYHLMPKPEDHDEEIWSRYAIARKLRHLYLPIVKGMGLHPWAIEIENDCDLLLNPRVVNQYRRLIRHSDMTCDVWCRGIAGRLEDLGRVHQIEVEISTRLKSPVSLWKKMRRTGRTIDQIYDIVAFRAVVVDVPECYAFREALLSEWHPVNAELDDYILKPKPSGYQALHVNLWDVSKQEKQAGELPRSFEVQIRSIQMHYDAEYGVCAHWTYKAQNESSNELLNNRLMKLRKALSKGGGDAGVMKQLGIT